MSVSVWSPRTALKVVIALIVTMGTLDLASAAPLGNSGLTPQECYRRDSDCTQFCGEVTGGLRYECFGICDRMLNRCLDTGDWTDSALIDPGTGNPPDKRDQLSVFYMRTMMLLADTDGDGVLSLKEIQSVRERVMNANGGPGTQTTVPTKP